MTPESDPRPASTHGAEVERGDGVDPVRLIATAAHDLRSPLMVIMSLSELIQGDPSLDARRAREFAATVAAKASEMRRLIDALSEIADSLRGARLQPAEIEIDSFFLEVTGERDGRAPVPTAVDLDISDAPKRWRADPTRLRRAVVAMMDWAGGTRHAMLAARERDGVLEIALRDKGREIGPEQIAALDATLSGREVGSQPKGVGVALGLVLAGIIAAEHGGTGGARSLASGDFEIFIRIPSAAGEGEH